MLEVAENNEDALRWYRKRNFYKLDAAIFMAQKVSAEPELLPPRKIPVRHPRKKRTSPPTLGQKRRQRLSGRAQESVEPEFAGQPKSTGDDR